MITVIVRRLQTDNEELQGYCASAIFKVILALVAVIDCKSPWKIRVTGKMYGDDPPVTYISHGKSLVSKVFGSYLLKIQILLRFVVLDVLFKNKVFIIWSLFITLSPFYHSVPRTNIPGKPCMTAGVWTRSFRFFPAKITSSSWLP